MKSEMMGEMNYAALFLQKRRCAPTDATPPLSPLPLKRPLPRESPGHDGVYVDTRAKNTRSHQKKTKEEKNKEGMLEKKTLCYATDLLSSGPDSSAACEGGVVGHLFLRLFLSPLVTPVSAFPPPVNWVLGFWCLKSLNHRVINVSPPKNHF